MQLRVDRQIALEEQLRGMADTRGVDIMKDALEHGRYPDLPAGRALIAKAYNQCVEDTKEFLSSRTAGVAGKYRALLRRIRPEVSVLVGMRLMLHACSNPTAGKLQDLLRDVGQALESEAMVSAIEDAAPKYLKRTLEYLDTGKTTSIEHRRRTFLAAAEHTIGGWNIWSAAEREGTAKLLMSVLWETGLFQWELIPSSRGNPWKYLRPSEVLAGHFEELLSNSPPVLRYEPMVCPPEPWTAFGSGGYLTPWMRVRSPMVSLRTRYKDQRDWVLQKLPEAHVVLSALNKAQGVAYRVNRDVLRMLQRAVPIESGVMGLPAHGVAHKPEFPFEESWKKASATPDEMDAFKLWKAQTAAWHAEDIRRLSKKRSVAAAANLLHRYRDETEIYFVSYLDSRGRVYFRGTVHPQSHDAVKGCLEFANGERLGPDGLQWLKVHVANCAGYDKADYPERVRWVDENWPSILGWLQDPIAQDAPDPSTSFCLYAAALDLQRALAHPDPAEYISHLPCAQDATCSGLQHFSAMFRDEVGGAFVNLTDSGGPAKADVYTEVASRAKQALVCDDLNIKKFWEEHGITRDMAKRPVMTFVYGSTLMSSMEYVAMGMAASGLKPIEEDGKVLYSLAKLSTPVAVALRAGIESTVPKAAAGMRYLQEWAARSAAPMRWITPVGMPVLNWAEGQEIQKVFIRSMGVSSVLMSRNTGRYEARKATDAIAPNFVHSMDAAHLCMVLHECPFDVVPIHDSFAALACHVPRLHATLRHAFVELYSTDPLAQLNDTPLREGLEIPVRPDSGRLDLRACLRSRFMFC